MRNQFSDEQSSHPPWVIFVSKAQPEQFLPFNLNASSAYRSALLEAYKDKESRSKLFGLSIFHRYLGHGITQAFTSGQDTPYKAVMSATKASFDRIQQFDEMEKKSSAQPNYKPLLCVALPVVVIDGRLFECIANEDGKFNVVEGGSSALFWKGTGSDRSSTLVNVVTKSDLLKFVECANEATQVFTDIALELL